PHLEYRHRASIPRASAEFIRNERVPARCRVRRYGDQLRMVRTVGIAGPAFGVAVPVSGFVLLPSTEPRPVRPRNDCRHSRSPRRWWRGPPGPATVELMGWYDDHVVPRLVNCVCGMQANDRYRARTCAGLRGRVVELG